MDPGGSKTSDPWDPDPQHISTVLLAQNETKTLLAGDDPGPEAPAEARDPCRPPQRNPIQQSWPSTHLLRPLPIVLVFYILSLKVPKPEIFVLLGRRLRDRTKNFCC
jgi:hypothetical protein